LGDKVLLVNLDKFGSLDHTCIHKYYHKQLNNQSKRKEKNSTTPILKETWTQTTPNWLDCPQEV